MPKLVVKQELLLPRFRVPSAMWWAVLAVLLLLGGATFWWMQNQQIIQKNFFSRSAPLATSAYEQEQVLLAQLIKRFEAESTQGIETHSKNERLIQYVDAILLQLKSLDSAVMAAHLDGERTQALLSSHQYQKDYWASQRHFQELRLSRFNPPEPSNTTAPVLNDPSVAEVLTPPVLETPTPSTPTIEASPAVEPTNPTPAVATSTISAETLPTAMETSTSEPVKKFKFATPPEGVALPSDFCIPGSGTCKAN